MTSIVRIGGLTLVKGVAVLKLLLFNDNKKKIQSHYRRLCVYNIDKMFQIRFVKGGTKWLLSYVFV